MDNIDKWIQENKNDSNIINIFLMALMFMEQTIMHQIKIIFA